MASQQSSSGSSSGQSSSASQSTSTPVVLQTPENELQMQIAQYAEGLAPQVYQWGMDQYNKNQGNIDGLMRDALSYASPQRISTDMGMAEAGVQQAGEQGRQAAIQDLQSYGIDPSSGRYAALDSANRVMSAASAAGAGNQQRMADIAAGNAMRQQAISSGLQNVQIGYGASNAMNNLLGTAMKINNPLMGQQSQSTSRSQSSQSSSQSSSGSSTDPASSGGSGTGGGTGSGTGGGGLGGGGSGGGGSSPGQVSPGMGTVSINGPDSSGGLQWPDPSTTSIPGTGGYGGTNEGIGGFGGDPLSLYGGMGDPMTGGYSYGGSGDMGGGIDYSNPFGTYGGTGGAGGYSYSGGNTGGGGGSGDTFSSGDPWSGGGIDSSGGGTGGGGGFNEGGEVSAYATGGEIHLQQGGPLTGYHAMGIPPAQNPYRRAPPSTPRQAQMFADPRQPAGNGPQMMAQGGPLTEQGGQHLPATTGGFVSHDLSPSNGAQVDDVDAKLNAGEFVIPRDVAAWKGKEFFHKLIAQARKTRDSGGQPNNGQKSNMQTGYG